jgi:hypothetical protein
MNSALRNLNSAGFLLGAPSAVALSGRAFGQPGRQSPRPFRSSESQGAREVAVPSANAGCRTTAFLIGAEPPINRPDLTPKSGSCRLSIGYR